jgi:NADH dehydrogenase
MIKISVIRNNNYFYPVKRKKVIIIGAGFGGLTAAKELKDSDIELIVVDKTNHHLFQPLLYQVATAALSPADIAVPIRAILSKQKNTIVMMDEAISIDKENQILHLKSGSLEFDYLIIAAGGRHSYFGKNSWGKFAPGLKTLNDALKIRETIINSLELAEKENEYVRRKKHLSFVVIGGGPTGVELAGAIAEIAKKTMIRDYKNFHPDETKIFLIEASPQILGSYSKTLSQKAEKNLRAMGIDVLTNTVVEDINENGVKITNGFIESSNLIWAAGNVASPLLKSLEIDVDKVGRAIVESDCSVNGFSNIFVIGDAAIMKDERGLVLPGIAPVAIQQGKYVSEIIDRDIPKERRLAFKYHDKGSMATIGKAKAVVEIKKLKFSGLFAWLIWSFVHIFFLISFRNRFRVMAEWIWYYITNKQGTRLIVGK